MCISFVLRALAYSLSLSLPLSSCSHALSLYLTLIDLLVAFGKRHSTFTTETVFIVPYAAAFDLSLSIFFLLLALSPSFCCPKGTLSLSHTLSLCLCYSHFSFSLWISGSKKWAVYPPASLLVQCNSYYPLFLPPSFSVLSTFLSLFFPSSSSFFPLSSSPSIDSAGCRHKWFVWFSSGSAVGVRVLMSAWRRKWVSSLVLCSCIIIMCLCEWRERANWDCVTCMYMW